MRGIPVQTALLFSPCFINSGPPHLSLERVAHKPSLAESLAPFHPDPLQRIVMLCLPLPYLSRFRCFLVFRVEALLDFLRSHEGSVVEWDEWKSHVVIPSISPEQWGSCTCVSGCRLFSLYRTNSSLGYQMDMYDFSIRGRVKYQSKQVVKSLPEAACLSSTGVVAQLKMGSVSNAHSGHDSVVFLTVSVIVLFCCPWEGN